MEANRSTAQFLTTAPYLILVHTPTFERSNEATFSISLGNMSHYRSYRYSNLHFIVTLIGKKEAWLTKLLKKLHFGFTIQYITASGDDSLCRALPVYCITGFGSVSLILLFIFGNGLTQSTANSLKTAPGPQRRVKSVILAVKFSTNKHVVGEKHPPSGDFSIFLSSSPACQVASKSSLMSGL